MQYFGLSACFGVLFEWKCGFAVDYSIFLRIVMAILAMLSPLLHVHLKLFLACGLHSGVWALQTFPLLPGNGSSSAALGSPCQVFASCLAQQAIACHTPNECCPACTDFVKFHFLPVWAGALCLVAQTQAVSSNSRHTVSHCSYWWHRHRMPALSGTQSVMVGTVDVVCKRCLWW